MGNVFRGFDRTQQTKRKSKDRIAVTLVQDLEGRRVSARRCVEQPFVCLLVRQSKLSILQERALPTV